MYIFQFASRKICEKFVNSFASLNTCRFVAKFFSNFLELPAPRTSIEHSRFSISKAIGLSEMFKISIQHPREKSLGKGNSAS